MRAHNKMDLQELYYTAQKEGRGTQAGLPVLGVATTGVFCRPGCGARSPKPENKHFFAEVRQALDHGYRPCKSCRPLSHPDFAPADWQAIVVAIEANPSKQWQAQDLALITPDAAAIDQLFTQRFGLTLATFAELRRLNRRVLK